MVKKAFGIFIEPLDTLRYLKVLNYFYYQQ